MKSVSLNNRACFSQPFVRIGFKFQMSARKRGKETRLRKEKKKAEKAKKSAVTFTMCLIQSSITVQQQRSG